MNAVQLILIAFSHLYLGLPSEHLSLDIPTKILYTLLISSPLKYHAVRLYTLKSDSLSSFVRNSFKFCVPGSLRGPFRSRLHNIHITQITFLY